MKTALVRTGNWDGSAESLDHEPTVVIDSLARLPDLLITDRTAFRKA
jgi:hypothetical protein